MNTNHWGKGLRAAASTCPAAVGLPHAIKNEASLFAAHRGEVTNPRDRVS
jgi:hypothetical protein